MPSKYKIFFLLILALNMFCLNSNILAEEEILNYEVEIYIRENSRLKIIERITVRAEGSQIKRGIYRDFPTKYKSSKGRNYSVGFKVDGIKKDGQREDYHLSKLKNGTRIYVGNKNVFLKPGVYNYTLEYSTTKQLGFFKTFDELYFNAIGHGWVFKILKAKVSVFLPKAVDRDALKIAGYTGRQGSVEQDFNHYVTSPSSIEFNMTRRLYPYEGFSIAIAFPKGIVVEPTAMENFFQILKDNILSLIAFLISLVGSLIHFVFWKKHGEDPKKGVIYPRFEAPENLRPYDLVFLKNMGISPKCLASALVGLACKKKVKIYEEKGILGFGSKITLESTAEDTKNLDEIERSVLLNLFSLNTIIACEQSNYRTFQKTTNFISSLLSIKLSTYFRKNSGLIFIGMGLQTIGVYFVLADGNASLLGLYAAFSLIPTFFFALIMRTYTKQGRKLMDEIEGYELYLTTAEKGHYDNIVFPQLSEENFEEHLPYAVALGCEAKWMTAFKNALEKAGKNIDSYSPGYYVGSGNFSDSRVFSGVSGGFSQTIASASSAPGSSSGSSGGGSSGGGGGGGGGGGW